MSLEKLREATVPTLLVINKIDLLKRRTDLLPLMQDYASRGNFAEIFPVSAKRGNNLDRLLEVTRGYLPESERLFREMSGRIAVLDFVSERYCERNCLRRSTRRFPTAWRLRFLLWKSGLI